MLELTVKEALEAGYTHCRYKVSDNDKDVLIEDLDPDNVSLLLNGTERYPYIYQTFCDDLVVNRQLFKDNFYQDDVRFDALLFNSPDFIWEPFLKQMQEWYDNNKLTQTKCVAKIINRRL